MKRTLPPNAYAASPSKKTQRVHHSLAIRQRGVEEFSASDPDVEVQFQLERAVSLALAAVGFDGVKLDALESFRTHVDQCKFSQVPPVTDHNTYGIPFNADMIRFLSTARAYANAAHRSQAIPQDFVAALAEANITSSSLLPLLTAPLPPSVVQPTLAVPPQEIPPPQPAEGLLGEALSGHNVVSKRRYIPAHIPDLPSRHTWQYTESLQKSETDPRKVREDATAEGILAEKALRELAVKQRETAHRKAMRDRHISKRQKDQEMWEQTVKGVEQLDEEERLREEERARREGNEIESSDTNWGLMIDDATNTAKTSLEYGAGTVVNFERQYWRRGSQTKA